jgi:hypothetical protein
MKMTATFLISLILIFPMIAAPGTGTQSSVISIKLTADQEDISWETIGYPPQGFKIIWSKNPNPTYPLRENDKYHYYSDPSENNDEIEAFDGPGTYYVRVCEYSEGKCRIYSNEIAISLQENHDENDIENDPFFEKNKEQEQTSNCNGCLINKTCYSLGHRMDGKFCGNNLSLIQQLNESSSCQNNFECESNVCISGECISTSFIQKVITWFKTIFS